ncbi:hypothetical protein ACRAWD_18310 [Caulobacter segnis]
MAHFLREKVRGRAVILARSMRCFPARLDKLRPLGLVCARGQEYERVEISLGLGAVASQFFFERAAVGVFDLRSKTLPARLREAVFFALVARGFAALAMTENSALSIDFAGAEQCRADGGRRDLNSQCSFSAG